MSVDTEVTTLSAAFDDYPHTLPLKRGEIKSPRLAFTFSDIRPANRFFKPMVRELKFDVSEMAIATYVQAKAYGTPLVLLPGNDDGALPARYYPMQRRAPLTPADLAGKRVGVRSYSQTTAVWVRGILQNDYGVDFSRVRWVTFEDGHVAEYHEPARRRTRRPRQEPAQDAARGRARCGDLWRRPAQRPGAHMPDPRSATRRRRSGTRNTRSCRSTTWS